MPVTHIRTVSLWAILSLLSGAVLALSIFFTQEVYASHPSALDGLQVTGTHVRGHTDKVPRLCNIQAPTHISVGSSNWSNPATWNTGTVPNAASRVHIRHTVTYDADSTAVIQCIEVQDGGHLTFATNLDTQLWLDDGLLVMPLGVLTVGTEASPVQTDKKTEIVFADTPLKTGTVEAPGPDPQQYGKGLLVFGDVTMYGLKKDPTFVRVTQEPKAGDTTLQLAQAPSGWSVGDMIILPDTRGINSTTKHGPLQDEILPIQSISGTSLTLAAPLQYDHLGARDDDGTPTVINGVPFLPHVGNLTRNIIFRSENSLAVRGHVQFFHRAAVDIKYAAFTDMGRTEGVRIDNSTFDANGVLTHIGTNQIARYTLHTHHLIGPVNPTNTGYQYQLVGNTVTGTRKWGIGIHNSSYGLIAWNVVALTDHTGITTETGSESNNDFLFNFVTTRLDVPVDISDAAEQLQLISPIWFEGPDPNGRVIGNVTAAYPLGIYFYFDRAKQGIISPCRGCVASEEYPINRTTLGEVVGNETYGTKSAGLGFRGIWIAVSANFPHSSVLPSFIRSSHLWNIATGKRSPAVASYGDNGLVFEDLVIRGAIPPGESTVEGNIGHEAVQAGYNTKFYRADIQGLTFGILSPKAAEGGRNPDFTVEGRFTIEDSFFSTRESGIRLSKLSNANDMPDVPVRVVLRNVRFSQLEARPEYHNVSAELPANSNGDRPTELVEIFVYDYEGITGNNFQIFYEEQAPSFPMSLDLTGAYGCPEADFTNQQCWDKYSITTAGAVAPCAAIDGDDCSAARARADALKVLGLVFPFTGDEPPPPPPPTSPPQLIITEPTNNSTTTSTTIDVRYLTTGDLTAAEADHIHFQLDDNPEVRGISLTGEVYTFQNVLPGPHSIQGYIAKADHTKVEGTDVTVSFTVEEAPPEPEPNTPPTISVLQDAFTVTIGETLTFTVRGEDADGDGLTVEIPDLNRLLPGATFESAL